ncbi:MAG: DUF3047 domain-containing protein [Pseudomonadota bacterium]
MIRGPSFRRWLGVGLALALFGAVAVGAADADDGPAISPGLEAAGWTLFSDPRWAPARFGLVGDGSIEAVADNSTSLIWKKVEGADADRRYLTWQWRVEENMPPTDITVKGGDDRPLAIHVWFMEPPERRTTWQVVRAKVLEFIFGLPVHGRVLTYVWGGTGDRGDAQRNPHIGEDSWMIVLRSGRAPTGEWFAETRDLEADYRAAFGEAPPPRGIVAIAADSEDTATRSRALVRDLRFVDAAGNAS